MCEKGTDRIIVYAFDATSGKISNHSETMVNIGACVAQRIPLSYRAIERRVFEMCLQVVVHGIWLCTRMASTCL